MPRQVDALLSYSDVVIWINLATMQFCQDLPQMLLKVFHVPQRISWEWELIRESWVTLAAYGLLHWGLVAAEIDSNWSQSLLSLGNTPSRGLCFLPSLWCAACDCSVVVVFIVVFGLFWFRWWGFCCCFGGEAGVRTGLGRVMTLFLLTSSARGGSVYCTQESIHNCYS